MKPFIFSADAHVTEPLDIFTSALPESMMDRAITMVPVDGYVCSKVGDKIVHRIKMGGERADETGMHEPGEKRSGSHHIDRRISDMERDGIDAELIFPSLGLIIYFIEEADVEAESCRIYNNWCHSHFSQNLDRFVPSAILPCRDVNEAIKEIDRVADIGYTAAMLPVVTPAGVPKYNDPVWEPLFAKAGERGVVIILHAGTGLEDFAPERGAGGAIINYTRLMCDAQEAIYYLVGSGILDRNPKAKVACIETGASWLAGLAERMDEVFDAHSFFVRPKLARRPSEIVRDQIYCSFQHDKACVLSREITGVQALLWASDYPHMEGTFPHSQKIIKHIFDGVDISDEDKAAILGLNAAKLFRLKNAALTI
jgi:predicted TIM-barrel fold metal-dependent hydrolase